MTIDLRERAHNSPKRAVLSTLAPTRTEVAVEAGRRSRSGRWATLAQRPEIRSRVTTGLVVSSGIGAALLADGSPAGIALADGVYRGLYAALVVWFASRARRWTWPILSGVAAVATASLFAQLFCVAALGLSLHALNRRGRRVGVVGSLIAAVSVPALLMQGAGPVWRISGGHLDDPFASSALITVMATAPVVMSGWKTLSRRRRRTIKRSLSRLALAGAGIVVVAVACTLISTPSMLSGLEHARQATQAANDGDLRTATTAFEDAADEWATANKWVSGPWMIPARLVPVVGQHTRAVQVSTGQASALSRSASALTNRIEPDELISEGTVSLEAVDALAPAAQAFASTTERATTRLERTRSAWLLAPLGHRLDRAIEILGQSAGLAGAASEALVVGSDLFGADQPTQILVMVGTPAEARGAGGFVGSWVVLELHEGAMSVAEQYHSRELNSLLDAAQAELNADEDYARRYGRFDVERHIQDVTLSPDFPSVARVAADLFEQATTTDVEAVLMVDPFVIEKLLGFTGPLDVGSDTPLTGANAAQELLIDQYQRFENDERAREAVLLGLTDQLLESLVDAPPDLVAFLTELAPLAEQNRLSLWLADDVDGSIVDRLGVSGSFASSADGLLAVVHQNAGQNKIDAYLERSVDVRTTLSPDTGNVTHAVTITLDNTAPSTGLSSAILGSNDQGLTPGTNRMLLSIYSSDRLVQATVDGQPAAVEHETEFGTSVYTTLVTIGAGDFVVVDVELAGRALDRSAYSMTIGAQALARPDAMSWRVTTDDGTRVSAPQGWTVHPDGARWAAELDRTEVLEFALGE